MIIEIDIYSSIRRNYESGELLRSISNSLGILCQTVKKYCEGDTHPSEINFEFKEYLRTQRREPQDVEGN